MDFSPKADAAATDSPVDETSSTPSKLKCLIVEDTRVHQLTLKRLLGRQGIPLDNITVAKNGIEALQVLFPELKTEIDEDAVRTHGFEKLLSGEALANFDVVFLDNEMPCFKGEELAALLDKSGHASTLRVIHTTTDNLNDKLKKLGNEKVTKPFVRAEINKTVQKLCEQIHEAQRGRRPISPNTVSDPNLVATGDEPDGKDSPPPRTMSGRL